MKFPFWKPLGPSAYIHRSSAKMLDSAVLLTCIFKCGCIKLHTKKGQDF